MTTTTEGQARIYVASKSKYGPMWRALRAQGHPIISTWIDESGEGETKDPAEFWTRCVREASSCTSMVVLHEDGEVMRGALVEMGAALAHGRPVFWAGPSYLSALSHPLVQRVEPEGFWRDLQTHSTLSQSLAHRAVKALEMAKTAGLPKPAATPDLWQRVADKVASLEQMEQAYNQSYQGSSHVVQELRQWIEGSLRYESELTRSRYPTQTFTMTVRRTGLPDEKVMCRRMKWNHLYVDREDVEMVASRMANQKGTLVLEVESLVFGGPTTSASAVEVAVLELEPVPKNAILSFERPYDPHSVIVLGPGGNINRIASLMNVEAAPTVRKK